MSIELCVQEIVKSVISVHHHIESIDIDAPLTGFPTYIADFELVYIVMELMEYFDISFDASDFENYNFNSIRGIVDAIRKHIN